MLVWLPRRVAVESLRSVRLRRTHEADGLAGVVLYHHLAARPETFPVLAQVPTLVVARADLEGALHFDVGPVAGAILRREDAVYRLSAHLAPVPAEASRGPSFHVVM